MCKQRYAQNQKLSQIGVDTRCMYDAEQSIPGFRGDVYMVGTVQSMQNLYAMRNMETIGLSKVFGCSAKTGIRAPIRISEKADRFCLFDIISLK